MVSIARPKRASAARLLLTLLAALALISTLPASHGSNRRSATLAAAQSTQIKCSAASPCPSSSPCCSAQGVCGSGAMQCAGGCQPMLSYKASSCLPNPVCRSRQLNIKPSDYNNTNIFTPILLYDGNATQSSFTIDAGSLGPGQEGVILKLTAAQQAKISTTDYLMYGYVEATLRHNARQGLVATFITMSSTHDEIDWEWTTADSSLSKTNYFWQGVIDSSHGTDVNRNNFNVADWHTYGLNWTSNQLQWTIDGSVVRTLTRAQAGNNYPRSPSQIQISAWAGGNSTNPPGVIDWSGGPIDWTTPEYQKNGYYWHEIKQFNVQCAPVSSLGLSNIAGAANSPVTSFVYTGTNDTQLGEPGFGTSTEALRLLSDPQADGYPGYPGYGQKLNSSGSGSSGFTTNLKKYGLPVIGGVVGIGLIWALVAYVRRRQRRSKAKDISAIGVTGLNDSRFSGSSSPVKPSTFRDAEHEPASKWRNESNMNMMMGGGIMSDAGLSHLQRQTTASSKLSSRSVTDRLMGNQANRYQHLDATAEEEVTDGPSDQNHARADGAAYMMRPMGYQGPADAGMTRDLSYDPTRRHDNGSYTSSNGGYTDPRMDYTARSPSPARPLQQVAPYTPNYAPQRPSGRMYDTPNANYYPTPVVPQTHGYMPAQAQQAAAFRPNTQGYVQTQAPQASGYQASQAPFGYSAYANMNPNMPAPGNGGFYHPPPPR